MAISRGASRGLARPGGAARPAARRRRGRAAARGPDGRTVRRRAGSARAGRGRRGGRAGAEKIAEPARHVGRVMPAQGLVGDLADKFAQPPLEAGAFFRRVEGVALGLAREQHFGERLGGASTSAIAARAARAGEIVGVLPLRQHARSAGSCPARSAAARRRWRGRPPCVPPCRRRSTGSARRRIVHSSAHCSLVSAVPSGATVWAKPAWVMAMTST